MGEQKNKTDELPKIIRQSSSNIVVAEGDNVIWKHDRRGDRGLLEPGAVIKNFTNSLFEQLPPEGTYGWGIVKITGPEVRGSSIYLGDGSMGRVHMTDSPDITGNIINAGFKDISLMHSANKAMGDVAHAFGLTNLKTEQKAIVLQGKREEYTFEFNNDVSPPYGNYTGSVDITHIPTGAKNNFTNFNYVAFEGEPTKFVELPKLKAEVAASKAVGATRGKIVSAPVTTALPANGEALQNIEALSQRISQCMAQGQKLEEVLAGLEKEYPGALQSMEHAKPGEDVTPKVLAQRIVQKCVQGEAHLR